MSDKPPSPFTGLDKVLLRSTAQPAQQREEPVRERPEKAPSPRPKRISTGPKQAHQSDRMTASTLASTLASYPDGMIETIRKVVKVPGREVSFVRLTPEEKAQLADIVYTYKRQGKRTSENEINRIAVNFILEDYKANGENSVLARVITALLA